MVERRVEKVEVTSTTPLRVEVTNWETPFGFILWFGCLFALIWWYVKTGFIHHQVLDSIQNAADIVLHCEWHHDGGDCAHDH